MKRALILAAIAFSILVMVFSSPAWGDVRLLKTSPSGQITDAGIVSTVRCGPTLSCTTALAGVVVDVLPTDAGTPINPNPPNWVRVNGGIRYGDDGGLATVINLGAGSIGVQSLGASTVTSGSVDTTQLVADTANVNTLTVGLVGATKVVTSQLVAPYFQTYGIDAGTVRFDWLAVDSLRAGIIDAGTVGVTNNLSVGGNTAVLGAQSVGGNLTQGSGGSQITLANGKFSTASYATSAATPGNATLNTASGRSAIATLASSVTITNNLVTPTTIIQCGLETLGIGAGTVICVPATGSFTCTAVSALGIGLNVGGAARFWWILQ